jgi:predicted enzyme related to lactoylglutathione lyase
VPTTEPLVAGVDFVAVPTDDFEASFRFYAEVLGLPCIARYGDMPGAEFQAGNLTLALMQNEAFGQSFRANSMPIALRVADVEAARERLLAAGVEFTTETFDSGVCHQAIFLDPAGNPLDLHHRYAPRHPRGDQVAAVPG